MTFEIGEAAGKIWHFLNDHPESTVDQACKSLSIDSGLCCMALGWLAREDKIAFDGDGKKCKLSLKPGA